MSSFYYDSPEYYDGEDYSYIAPCVGAYCGGNAAKGIGTSSDPFADLRKQVGEAGGTLGTSFQTAVGNPGKTITDSVLGEANAIQQPFKDAGKTVTDSVLGESNAIQENFTKALKNIHQGKLDAQKDICGNADDNPLQQINKFIAGCGGSSPGLGSIGCLPGVPNVPPLGCFTIPVVVAGGLVLFLLLKSR